MRYRKKPVVFEAFQMTAANMVSNVDWPTWLHAAWQMDTGVAGSMFCTSEGRKAPFSIATMDDVIPVDIDDWIKRCDNGEIYPCKPDIFERDYEMVTVDHGSQ